MNGRVTRAQAGEPAEGVPLPPARPATLKWTTVEPVLPSAGSTATVRAVDNARPKLTAPALKGSPVPGDRAVTKQPFDWSASERPSVVPIGTLVPIPPHSNDPAVQARREAEWRAATEQARQQREIGTPYAQRPEVRTFFTNLARSMQLEPRETADLMRLVERVPLPRETPPTPPGTTPEPDSSTTFERSVRNYLNAGIERGVQFALEHHDAVSRIAAEHGLDAAAVYGTLRGETNMGAFHGGHNAFQQLVRGAFDGSRQPFYKGELTALVRLSRRPEYSHWDLATLGGSSAGALGWCQFMPSNIERLGIVNGRGLDPFHRTQSVELVARFHQSSGGWVRGQPVGVELRGTADAIRTMQHDREMTVGQLRAAGFTIPASFPDATRGRLLRFGTDQEPAAYFSGPNAVVLRKYNWGERHYGDRAGLLAGRIEAEAQRRAAPR